MIAAYYVSLFTIVATWMLLIIGGLVNPMGASMACPDWYFFPTCNGEILPAMVGGVLYEHGHRLAATLVGISTLTLSFFCCRAQNVDRQTKILSVLALMLVITQGVLGGVTVLLNLSAVISTLHLSCAMIFFSLLIYISFRLSPYFKPMMSVNSSWPLTIAIILTLVQLIYGGMVRHLGAGLACGDDLIGCGPEIWPSWFYGQLHMGHRLLGYTLLLVVLYVCLKKDRLVNKIPTFLSIAPLLIISAQIILGLLAVYTIRSPVILALHTGFGALLLASLLIMFLMREREGVLNFMTDGKKI